MAAILGPLIIEGVLALGGTFGAGIFATNIIVGLGGSLILSALGSAIAGKPDKPSLAGAVSGRQDMIRQPIAPRRTIYGTAFVSGPLVYAQSFGEIDGLPNLYLSLLVALASHEIEAIDQVWFNDQRCRFLQDGVTVGSPFSTRAAASDPEGGADVIIAPTGTDFAHVYKHFGAANQTADSRLVADSGGKWTAAHRLRGIAYVHARLRFDRLETMFHDGAPTVRALVKGKKLRDVRSGSWPNDTPAWTNNPALVVLDYLTAVRGVATSRIDTASFIAAANVCDETVTKKNGATENRYTCNGTVDDDERPVEVMLKLLSSMAGTLARSGGTFYLHAGGATAATLDLDETDLAGPTIVHPVAPRHERFNAVKPVYVAKDKGWQPQDAPLQTSASAVAEDGEEIVQTIDLPFTVTSNAAQRLGRIEFERGRRTMTVDATLGPIGLRLKPWDTITLSHDLWGFAAKKFRVISQRIEPDGRVPVSLREEDDAMWSFAAVTDETEEDPTPDTTLPNPRVVPAPGALTITEELRASSGQIVTVLLINLGPVVDGLVVDVEAQIQAGAGAFKALGVGDVADYEFAPAKDGTTYTVRARAINHIGARSPWTTASYTVTGQVAPPADVAGFAVNIRGAEAQLTWDPVADVDLSHYRVRWASTLLAANWSGAIDLVPRVGRPATSVTVPALVGTYLIKAIDRKGNESVNAAMIVTTIGDVAGLNVVATVQEDTAFAGTHAGTAVDGAGRLHLNGVDTLASWSALSAVEVLALGEDDALVGSGTYTFGTTFDLGAVDTARLTPDVLNLSQNYANTVESWQPLSSVTRLAGTEIGGQNVALEVRRTDDDPGGSPTWTAWAALLVGDYRARAFQFRANLTSTLPHVTPLIERLRVAIDMTDRTVEGHDLASGTDAGGFAVVYAGGAFRAAPAIGISAQGMATGDFYEFVAKTAAGFTIRFKNSAGTVVSRTFDYIAKGYGTS